MKINVVGVAMCMLVLAGAAQAQTRQDFHVSPRPSQAVLDQVNVSSGCTNPSGPEMTVCTAPVTAADFAPPLNAYDYAMKMLTGDLKRLGIQDANFKYHDLQAFRVTSNGKFEVGGGLSERDAMLILFANEVHRQADAAMQATKAQEAARADRPPQSVSAGNTTYRLQDSELWNPYVIGDTNCSAHQIRTVDTSKEKRVALLHELMHVATNCDSTPALHRAIQQMSPKLLELLRDNPALVTYLMSPQERESTPASKAGKSSGNEAH